MRLERSKRVYDAESLWTNRVLRRSEIPKIRNSIKKGDRVVVYIRAEKDELHTKGVYQTKLTVKERYKEFFTTMEGVTVRYADYALRLPISTWV